MYGKLDSIAYNVCQRLRNAVIGSRGHGVFPLLTVDE